MKRSSFIAAAFAVAFLVFGPLGGKTAVALPAMGIQLNPIQICDDAGNNCANNAMELFEAEGAKIWGQADIQIQWLGWSTINSTALLNGDDFSDYTANANTSIINIYFMESLSECGGPANPLSLFGCGGGGRIGVTDLVFDFNGGNGRRDTISHELGHVLGLGHNDFGAGGADNLMTSGGSRSIPDGVGNINPDGSALSKLTDAQIAEARSSSRLFAVPEPGMALIFAAGFLVLAARRRA